jgi:ribonuclease HI
MYYDPHALKIHIDGSAYGNPGHIGGIAAIIEFPDSMNREPETIIEKGFSETTNNRMELRACISALEWSRQNAKSIGCPRIIIVTDSLYVFNNVKNASYWKKAKWRNKDGRPVENSDLWDALLSLRSKIGIRTDIEWNKGKTTEIGKEVDRRAKQSAKSFGKTADSGYQSGKISRTKLPGGSADMFPAQNQEATIRIYRKELKYHAKQNEYKIFFELFSDEQNKYTSKYFAYTPPENECVLHRAHFYRVQFNNNQKYPIIEKVIDELG